MHYHTCAARDWIIINVLVGSHKWQSTQLDGDNRTVHEELSAFIYGTISKDFSLFPITFLSYFQQCNYDLIGDKGEILMKQFHKYKQKH